MIAVALILTLASPARADADASYAAGIAASRAGDPVAAERAFRDALAEGGLDPAVYHGLGNALYRQGHLGEAIAAWRRGLVLRPSDGDLAANLSHAQGETKDHLDPPPPELGPFFWQRTLPVTWTLTAAGWLLALAIGLPLLTRLRPALRRPALRPAAALCGLAGTLLVVSSAVALRQPPTGVIVAPQVAARSTPGPDGVDLFLLHEGAEVRLGERADGTTQVILADGRKGWISDTALVSADPAAPFPDAVL